MRKFVIVIFVIICTIFLTGCSKDRVIKIFDDASKKFGDEILTKDNDLIGKRSFGIDHYTGTYVSNYENSTKNEIIFGGTTLNRDEGNIHIKIYLEKASGEITIKMNLNEEEKILNEYYKEIEKRDELNIEINQIHKKIELENEDLINNESSLKNNNQEYNKAQEELKSHEIKVNRLDVKIDNLLNILTNDYSISYEKAKEKYILEIDSDEARSIVSTLKREIKSLGDVNVGAIEEYDRVKERYEFLNKQKEDLTNAENVLLEIITEMDDIMKDKFSSTFNKIKEAFNETFRKLFNGGKAELKLTDPSNILETGIDIIALPPGKKLQHISLLSGGEKTLTAIALLFSILKVRPVPFCILDEVEAALDEVNVDNFGKYLKEFKGDTQFIIITHKKKTMEYADVLYGITMQESGVSKLVSVKLEELKN